MQKWLTRAKFVIWVVGFALWIYGMLFLDWSYNANVIQVLSAPALIISLGLFVEHSYRLFVIVQHVKELPEIHRMLKELHAHHLGKEHDDVEHH